MSNTVLLEYLPLMAWDANTHLKVEVYYHLGGMNWFTARSENRGYYLSVSPIERHIHEGGYTTESFVMLTGRKLLLLECSRKSAKQAHRAVEISVEKRQGLIEMVLAGNNLALAETDATEAVV